MYWDRYTVKAWTVYSLYSVSAATENASTKHNAATYSSHNNWVNFTIRSIWPLSLFYKYILCLNFNNRSARSVQIIIAKNVWITCLSTQKCFKTGPKWMRDVMWCNIDQSKDREIGQRNKVRLFTVLSITYTLKCPVELAVYNLFRRKTLIIWKYRSRRILCYVTCSTRSTGINRKLAWMLGRFCRKQWMISTIIFR